MEGRQGRTTPIHEHVEPPPSGPGAARVTLGLSRALRLIAEGPHAARTVLIVSSHRHGEASRLVMSS